MGLPDRPDCLVLPGDLSGEERMSEKGYPVPQASILEFIGLFYLVMGLVISGHVLWIACIQPLWGKPPIGVSLERLGILFQTMAILSVIPELLGERRLARMGDRVQRLHIAVTVTYRGRLWRALRSGSVTVLVLSMVTYALSCCIGFAWYQVFRIEIPQALETNPWLTLALILWTSGVGFAWLTTRWITAFAMAVLSLMVRLLPLRRLSAVVTLPLLIVGNILELVSAFIQ